METQQNTTKLTTGTALILLKESTSYSEFRSCLDSLGISSHTAYIKMERAIEENLIRFYPQNKIVRPKLTLPRNLQ
jgi:maleate cis-trans isomerase